MAATSLARSSSLVPLLQQRASWWRSFVRSLPRLLSAQLYLVRPAGGGGGGGANAAHFSLSLQQRQLSMGRSIVGKDDDDGDDRSLALFLSPLAPRFFLLDDGARRRASERASDGAAATASSIRTSGGGFRSFQEASEPATISRTWTDGRTDGRTSEQERMEQTSFLRGRSTHSGVIIQLC